MRASSEASRHSTGEKSSRSTRSKAVVGSTLRSAAVIELNVIIEEAQPNFELQQSTPEIVYAIKEFAYILDPIVSDFITRTKLNGLAKFHSFDDVSTSYSSHTHVDPLPEGQRDPQDHCLLFQHPPWQLLRLPRHREAGARLRLFEKATAIQAKRGKHPPNLACRQGVGAGSARIVRRQ